MKLYKYLREEKKSLYCLKQLLRSGTSIGANISEAQQGQSKKDFVMKMNISLKECAETEYWLKLLAATDYLNKTESEPIIADCTELGRLLTSIVQSSASSLK